MKMRVEKYISCFSGIGGLEGSTPPAVCCEIDEECQEVLRRRFPEAQIVDDVQNLRGVEAEVICGGFPCQDLSVAGLREGLHGKQSRLFFDFLEASLRVNATTIIVENVPNLFNMNRGDVFREILRNFVEAGFSNLAWRILNVRNFGIPHQRRRIFIIASKELNPVLSVHRAIPSQPSPSNDQRRVGAFYWTAGLQSICYSSGFIPTLKVGSSLSIPSPPAIHYDNNVRLLTPTEALRLQGFESKDFSGLSKNAIYRMAGNAVAAPVGRFVVDGVLKVLVPEKLPYVPIQPSLLAVSDLDCPLPRSGVFDGKLHELRHPKPRNFSRNLCDFLEQNVEDRLSVRATRGLLNRLSESGLPCPPDLMKNILEIAREAE